MLNDLEKYMKQVKNKLKYINQMENLIRKLAWKYARQAFNNELAVDFEELMAEANLAYLEALRTHDEEKGKVTTHIWNTVSGHLQNYLKEELKHKHLDFSEVDIPKSSVPYFEKLSKEAQQIASLALSNPRYVCMDKEEAQLSIIAELLNNGWQWSKIYLGLKNLKTVFNQ